MLKDEDIREKAERAEKSLGITFADKDLLIRALIHRSYSFEAGIQEMNEKLEFLGDTVLNLVITEFIFYRYPELSEGDLAKLRARIVNASALAKAAQAIGLGELILMGKGAEMTGGRERASILGDAFEAVIGAVYIDRGIVEAKEFVLLRLRDTIFEEASSEYYGDPKTHLQETIMAKRGLSPEYRTVKELGPVHDKTFIVEVRIGNKVWGKGAGKSKKQAEQIAATEALKKLS